LREELLPATAGWPSLLTAMACWRAPCARKIESICLSALL
jgi:hypothetical protein